MICQRHRLCLWSMSSTTEVVLSIEVVCEKCGNRRGPRHSVFLEMAPKVGSTEPFYLCVRCWLDRDGFDAPAARAYGRVLEAAPPTAEAVTAPLSRDGRASLMTEGDLKWQKKPR